MQAPAGRRHSRAEEPIMLRFDVPPIPANVARLEAFVNFLFCVVAWFASPWWMAVPAVQGLVRGFLGHRRCPSHLLWRRLLGARAGKLENAGAKMFAYKILFVASVAALAFATAGSGLWRVPVGALLVFTTLEWAAGFCAACWVYGAWYKRFPPKGA